MALARARALRTLQSTLKPSSSRSFATRPAVPRASVQSRTKQVVQRRYASGGGAHGEESSDVPWAIGAVVVTVPACWYLWPESGHADHHGAHGGEHEEHAEEGGEEEEGKQEEGGEEQQDGGEEKQEDAGEEKSEGGEEKQDSSESKGDSSDSKEDADGPKVAENPDAKSPAGGEQSADTPPTEEQETSPGGGGGKEDETVVERKSNERKIKKKPDSGQEIGKTEQSFKENPQGGPSMENPATAKEPEKGKSGEITGKQFGLSTGPTKHSLPIDSDASKSKKGEGTPETAKAQGTVDPNRPAR
ncbi:uncharacterized protein LTR77_007182 [Saxophila tyrrhenica]|uniref:Uncharacterized protein n=1 Tax=Saxophila tyrrhenica TaxID=1690608 RepID=A0AAV9P3Y7_9PEZI|nr:hypothetical protein LTR77_007182 [Saxophila tyrrhenica]